MRFSVNIERFAYPDGTLALSGIRFDLPQGEFSGILGGNGSGKTTLLRVMDGLHKDFSGQVLLDGKDIRQLSPRDIYRRVGLVFQNPDDQLFAQTVYEDVAFGPRNMGFREAEVRQRVEEALTGVDLSESAGRPIGCLSYGQKKRACIAGLLAMGHEILLLDEPTAGLDPQAEERMLEVLQRLNRENGVTIVMATHNVDLVPLHLHRLQVLDRGRVALSGSPQEVFCSPQELAQVRLRLPWVAELAWQLKHSDGLPLHRLPLTVGAARREMLELLHIREKEIP